MIELVEGDRILFEGRRKPLEVKDEIEDGYIVEGPNGGEYEIYEENDALLYCRKGDRKYSSYCENLRKVGEWNRKENKWSHSGTGAEVSLRRDDTGHWVIHSSGIELDIDTPRYGFNDRETAEREVEKFLEKHPEG